MLACGAMSILLQVMIFQDNQVVWDLSRRLTAKIVAPYSPNGAFGKVSAKGFGVRKDARCARALGPGVCTPSHQHPPPYYALALGAKLCISRSDISSVLMARKDKEIPQGHRRCSNPSLHAETTQGHTFPKEGAAL